MVKKRQPPSRIVDVEFAADRRLAMEVLTIQSLLARERHHDLSRPQRAGFHHFFLPARGEGTHTVDFVRHRLRPGLALHVGPGQVQQFGREPGFDAGIVIFKADFVRFLPSLASVPVQPDDGRLRTLTELFDVTRREFSAFDGSERSEALLRTLVEAIGLALNVGPALPEGAALVQQFLAALDKSFRGAHEVAAYAAVLRCSTRTLTRHCERWARKTAKQLIDERIALEARRLLAHEGAPLAELAVELGFAEATQFGKFFRRLTGETPAGFRARFRSG